MWFGREHGGVLVWEEAGSVEVEGRELMRGREQGVTWEMMIFQEEQIFDIKMCVREANCGGKFGVDGGRDLKVLLSLPWVAAEDAIALRKAEGEGRKKKA